MKNKTCITRPNVYRCDKAQCAFSDFRFAPFWEKEKLPSITNPFLAGNDSYDGFIDCYQKKKCGKVWESMFFHLCLLSL